METEYEKQFLYRLGKLVVEFGRMERTIRFTVIQMVRDDELAKTLVPPSNMVSHNLELLKRMTKLKIKESAQSVWFESINGLEKLFEERNKIFHGTFYSIESPTTLARHRKGRKTKSDDVVWQDYDLDSLDCIYDSLYAYSRQLSDFSDDFYRSESPEGSFSQPSQTMYLPLRYQ
ncbi:hypothetical protein AAFX24_00980 [Vibrio mediterranei]|uniref:hypothetical protein n=1 Tax=Vibrio mediterranei TaxID=689 RepID=UPI0038CEF186